MIHLIDMARGRTAVGTHVERGGDGEEREGGAGGYRDRGSGWVWDAIDIGIGTKYYRRRSYCAVVVHRTTVHLSTWIPDPDSERTWTSLVATSVLFL